MFSRGGGGYLGYLMENSDMFCQLCVSLVPDMEFSLRFRSLLIRSVKNYYFLSAVNVPADEWKAFEDGKAMPEARGVWPGR